LLTILGGVALTLFGVSQVRESVTNALGPQLRLFLEKSTRYRWQAFSAGVLVTSLIQSATATVLIVTSFAARRLIPVAPALAVSLGADVGTTLVAQIFSFGFNWLGPVFILIGMVSAGWFPHGRMKHVGLTFVGLGLVLLGLGTIIHTAEMVEKSAIIKALIESLTSDRFMTFLIGALITWAAQSSLAVVLLIMSFASSHLMPVDTAFCLVLGTHVGSSIMPLLVNIKQKNEAGQIAWGGFLMRLGSCLLFLLLVPYATEYVQFFGRSIERQVVNFHTASSVARALIFLPFLGLIEKLLQKLFPFSVDLDDPSRVHYLDERDLTTPSVALASAARESLRLGDQVLTMLRDVKVVFQNHHPGKLQQLLDRDNHVDRLYEQIKFYLAKLSREAMDDDQARRHVDLLMFITNLEHIGDIVVKNLCELAEKKWRNNLSFSKQGWLEIELYHTKVCENFQLALNVFNSGDPMLARELVRHKEALSRDSMSSAGSHFERLRQGLMESMRSSSLHLDIIRDLRRVNDYLTSIAYSILEAKGALQSRLRED